MLRRLSHSLLASGRLPATGAAVQPDSELGLPCCSSPSPVTLSPNNFPARSVYSSITVLQSLLFLITAVLAPSAGQSLWVPFVPWVFSQVSEVHVSRLSAAVTWARDAKGRAELLVQSCPVGQGTARQEEGKESTRRGHAPLLRNVLLAYALRALDLGDQAGRKPRRLPSAAGRPAGP